MMRFIFQNWRRRKERFLLLIIGVFIISSGLTYLVGLTEINKQTIVHELEKRWSASYDIVARPEGSKSTTEGEGLLDPNYLSGISGGISIDQYEKIKQIPEVEIAAPIAMIGYISYIVNVSEIVLEEAGVYRYKIEETISDGINEKGESVQQYLFVYDSFNHPTPIFVSKNLLIAGIDPDEEAKLAGLDGAIVKIGESRYFSKEDLAYQSSISNEPDKSYTKIPVLINYSAFSEKKMKHSLEKLDIPFDTENLEEKIHDIFENEGGQVYFDGLDGELVTEYSLTDEEAYILMMESISQMNLAPENANTGAQQHINSTQGYPLFERPGPLYYKQVDSPYPETWPYAYQLEKKSYIDHAGNERESFRKPHHFEKDGKAYYPMVDFEWIGFYDPGKLDLAKDPTNELPMETYRPAMAELVFDKNMKPENPPKKLMPTDYLSPISTSSFLAQPPAVLTTLDAAEKITGEKPISAIRIKVHGVSDFSEESQQKLEEAAEKIEKETGLITDITLGSSPQPTLVNIPSIADEDELGWFQQPWIKLGSSITIFRESQIGYSGLIFTIVAVGVIYVWTTSLVSLLSRRKEFAVLSAIGWKPKHISKIFFLESLLLGTFAAFISWTMLAIVYLEKETVIDPARFLATGLFGLAIYLLGAIFPSLLSRRVQTYEAIRTGESIRSGKRFFRTRGIFTVAVNNFFGKWKRNLLSVFAIAMPASLLSIFLVITFRLQGVMYLTWLGQYIALEVGPVQYTAMIVALIIAILTTAELMWQNISDRQEEIAIFKAVGWSNRNIRFLIWSEGLITGLFAAIIGFILTFVITLGLYGEMPGTEIPYILAASLIPIIVGFLGTVFPAETAVRIMPVQGMSGRYANEIFSGKKMKWFISCAMVLLIGGFLYTMIQIAAYL